MVKSNWFKPYTTNKNGKLVAALKDCWACAQSGVYFIRHIQTKSIVYIGQSQTQLKKTIYRHFQQWTDKQQSTNRNFDRKTYPKTGYYEIRFIKCTAAQAMRLESYLILKNNPKDNELKYSNLTTAQKNSGKNTHIDFMACSTLPKYEYLEIEPF